MQAKTHKLTFYGLCVFTCIIRKNRKEKARTDKNRLQAREAGKTLRIPAAACAAFYACVACMVSPCRFTVRSCLFSSCCVAFLQGNFPAFPRAASAFCTAFCAVFRVICRLKIPAFCAILTGAFCAIFPACSANFWGLSALFSGSFLRPFCAFLRPFLRLPVLRVFLPFCVVLAFCEYLPFLRFLRVSAACSAFIRCRKQ